MCIDVRVGLYMSICVDTSIDICTCADMCTDMRMDMRADMYFGKCISMYIDCEWT